MFSRPEKSRLKPAASSSSDTTRPPQAASPECSGTIPASTRSVEVLPAPLRPTMPTVSPGAMWRLTPCSAGTASGPAALDPSRSPLSVRPASARTSNERVASRSTISPGAQRRAADGGAAAHTTTASSPSIRRNTNVPAASATAATAHTYTICPRPGAVP